MVVPYPGEYDLTVGNESRTVTVSERAVENGTRVGVENETGPDTAGYTYPKRFDTPGVDIL